MTNKPLKNATFGLVFQTLGRVGIAQRTIRNLCLGLARFCRAMSSIPRISKP